MVIVQIFIYIPRTIRSCKSHRLGDVQAGIKVQRLAFVHVSQQSSSCVGVLSLMFRALSEAVNVLATKRNWERKIVKNPDIHVILEVACQKKFSRAAHFSRNFQLPEEHTKYGTLIDLKCIRVLII